MENGLSVFLASRELDQFGDSRSDEVIDEALYNTKHMVVVASSAAHLNSNYVSLSTLI